MMKFRLIKWILMIALFFAVPMAVNAQQTHFIYLQTENGKPFYVKYNNSVVSSSLAGYIILPEIKEGDIQLIVGFPKNEFPEEKFNLAVKNSNEGFLLKNFNEKGWALFNLQSLAVIKGNSGVQESTETTVQIQNDPFTNMLADVVNDSSLLREKIPVVPEPVVSEKPVADTAVTIIPEANTSPVEITEATSQIIFEESADPGLVVETKTQEPTENTKAEIIVSPEKDEVEGDKPIVEETIEFSAVKLQPDVKKNPDISRILIVNEKGGLEMIYVVKEESKNDSIRIFMPVAKMDNPNNAKIIIAENKPSIVIKKVDTAQLTITPTKVNPFDLENQSATDTSEDAVPEIIGNPENEIVVVEQTPEPTPVIIYNPEPEKKEIVPEPEKTIPVPEPEKIEAVSEPEEKQNQAEIIVANDEANQSSINKDCKAIATMGDFKRLRKIMAAENTSEDMIYVATKEFKNICFSTEQIKNLSYLFLNDEGKYQFFDAAYSHTSDTGQFTTLESQLTDPYYINRFKAMIHP